MTWQRETILEKQQNNITDNFYTKKTKDPLFNRLKYCSNHLKKEFIELKKTMRMVQECSFVIRRR